MEKPILFNTAMVKAILEGKKTCTRRIVKPHRQANIENMWIDMNDWESTVVYDDNHHIGEKGYIKIPYKVGDIIYVRETWLKADDKQYYYRADETTVSKEAREDFGYKWKPSIHMPKEAARIFLEVIAVHAERLQDITEDGARAEGCIDFYDKIGDGKFEDVLEFDLTARDAFTDLWNSTVNKKDIDKYCWDANPWVWVIEFKVKEVKR